MSIYLLSWTLGSVAVFLFFDDFEARLRAFFRPKVNWLRSIHLLVDLREKLESGYLPDPQEWESLKTIDPPWGALAHENIIELREGGISVIPSLVRFEKMIREQNQADQESRSKCAQAWGQAVVCGAIVPIIAGALYFLVPGLSEYRSAWWVITAFSLILDGMAMLWMMSLCESARWAGLSFERREWWPSAMCFGERLLGLLRSGVPADLAWSKAIPRLNGHASDLVNFWGPDIWADLERPSVFIEPAAKGLIHHGLSLRKAIQVSIYEGRGCYERIEAAIDALRIELQSEVQRQVQLLSTRSLKPLFLCVAPSVLLLLVAAFALTWEKWVLL